LRELREAAAQTSAPASRRMRRIAYIVGALHRVGR
jgi:hypothetical protein